MTYWSRNSFSSFGVGMGSVETRGAAAPRGLWPQKRQGRGRGDRPPPVPPPILDEAIPPSLRRPRGYKSSGHARSTVYRPLPPALLTMIGPPGRTRIGRTSGPMRWQTFPFRSGRPSDPLAKDLILLVRQQPRSVHLADVL